MYVPIFNFKVQVKNSGTKTTFNLNEADSSFMGITSGNGKDVSLTGDYDVSDVEEIMVIPVLRGRTDAGTEKDYVCDDGYGMKIYPAG